MDKRILSSLLVLGSVSTGLGCGEIAHATKMGASKNEISAVGALDLLAED